MTARVTGNAPGDAAAPATVQCIAQSDPVVSALTALRDAALVVDRDQLNTAWSELTGRTAPTSGTRCQHRGCHEVGIVWLEPAEVWCAEHKPHLWRNASGSPWATPRCRCGAPAAYPTARFGVDPCCRDHAPRRMHRYLITTETEEKIA